MIKLEIKYGNDQTDIRFPCTEKALQEALAEIDAEQVRPLELYVTEVVFPEELAFLEDRFANLDEVNYLAKRMSLSRSTVKRAVKDLEKAGLIRKEPHYRENGSATSNRYYLL